MLMSSQAIHQTQPPNRLEDHRHLYHHCLGLNLGQILPKLLIGHCHHQYCYRGLMDPIRMTLPIHLVSHLSLYPLLADLCRFDILERWKDHPYLDQ